MKRACRHNVVVDCAACERERTENARDPREPNHSYTKGRMQPGAVAFDEGLQELRERHAKERLYAGAADSARRSLGGWDSLEERRAWEHGMSIGAGRRCVFCGREDFLVYCKCASCAAERLRVARKLLSEGSGIGPEPASSSGRGPRSGRGGLISTRSKKDK